MNGRAMIAVLVLCLVLACAGVAPADELRVGVGKRVITPDPLLPVSGGLGPTAPAREKRGELTARAIVFPAARRRSRWSSLDLLGFPSVLGDRVRRQVPRIAAGEHPDRLDAHAQCAGLLRLSRRARGTHGRPGVHGLRLPAGGRGGQRGARSAPAGPAQGGHRRGPGQDRLQLLRARPVRPADERDPGGRARRQDDRHARQLRDSSRSARRRRRHPQPRPGRAAVRPDRGAGRRHGHVHERRSRGHDHGRQPQPRPAQGRPARLLARQPHVGGVPADRPHDGGRGAAHRAGRPGAGTTRRSSASRWTCSSRSISK